MKLSELLKGWREDSPNEETMDAFITEAELLELELKSAKEKLDGLRGGGVCDCQGCMLLDNI